MTESTSSPASLSADDKKHKLAMAVQVLSEIANTLEEDIKELNLEMKENNRLLKEQAKMKRLELAHSRPHFGKFVFHTLGCHQGTYSKVLAKEIINFFILGCSCTLSKDASVLDNKGLYDDCTSDNEEYQAGKAVFREKIVAQLEMLIGHEPRLVDNGDGSFALY